MFLFFIIDMPRMRRVGNWIVPSHPPLEQPSRVPVMDNFHVCTTKIKEMQRVLAVCGIKIPHFAYEFSILEGSYGMSEVTKDSFLLPLHAFKAGFHLPLHHFFCNLLKDYKVAPCQLLGFSWWIIVAILSIAISILRFPCSPFSSSCTSWKATTGRTHRGSTTSSPKKMWAVLS